MLYLASLNYLPIPKIDHFEADRRYLYLKSWEAIETGLNSQPDSASQGSIQHAPTPTDLLPWLRRQTYERK